MARVKGALMTRKRRKKVLKLAKGYWGSKSATMLISAVNTESATSVVSGSPEFLLLAK